MAKLSLVSLCRYGDLAACAIPAAYYFHQQGDEVSIVVAPGFASILDGCSYINKIELDTHARDVAGGIKLAMDLQFDRVIAIQANGNPSNATIRTRNFVTEMWSRAGLLEKFHDVPLIFDKRDAKADAFVVKCNVPLDDGRPLLGFNLIGHSSKVANELVQSQTRWIKETFGKSHRLLNIGDICCRHVLQLLPLIESCDVLISVDTLTMHLSYATKTPLIAYSIGKSPEGKPSEYYDSEPRSNWIYRSSYEEMCSGEGRAEVAALVEAEDYAPGKLVRDVIPVYCRLTTPVAHIADWFLGNVHDNPRILAARRTFNRQASIDKHYRFVEHKIRPGQRTSKDIGDTRTLPYIKDIIRRGCEEATDDTIVIFSNSDVCLTYDAIGRVRERLLTEPCCFSRRIDCNIQYALEDRWQHDLANMEAHVGADLFAAKKTWWEDHLEELPDVFLACEGFDFCMRHYFWIHSNNAEISPPIILHPAHRSYWAHPDVILDNSGQKHNRKECERFVRSMGWDKALWSGRFLFKDDKKWTK